MQMRARGPCLAGEYESKKLSKIQFYGSVKVLVQIAKSLF